MGGASAGPVAATPQPAAAPPSRLPAEARKPSPVGNQAVLRRLQPKLAVGAADDPLEHEADVVAEQVMRAPDPEFSVSSTPPTISRKCASCDAEEKVQPKRAGDRHSSEEAPAAVDEALRQPGQPLDAPTRGFFEPRFGADFSAVRVHTGMAAHRSATSVAALGYTVGQDVVFANGRFAPATHEGRKLLAHELAHVVQQNGARRTLARKAPADSAGPYVVEAMDPAEAVRILKPWLAGAEGSSEAAVHAIGDTLDLPFTMENARRRVRQLTAAVSVLDAKDAAMVLGALTKPDNDKQKAMQAKFGRLDHRFRTPLLAILGQRAQPAPAHEEKPKQDAAAASKWSELNPGVAAYLADTGETIEHVALRISGYPPTADALSELNGIAKGVRFDAPRQIIVPADLIDRIEVFHQMPSAIGRSLFEARQGKQQMDQTLSQMTVRSGHPAGPGAFGLVPVTTSVFMRPGLIDGAKYAAGFLVGLLEGAWHAVRDLFVGAWEMIKAVGETLARLFTLQFGKIWEMMKGWVAKLKLLWNNRAEIAADFMDKWEAKDPWDRGVFQGDVLGWVITTVLITILTLGEGAIEQISGKWANVAKLLKVAQQAGDIGTYAKAFTGVASKAATAAIDAMRASRLAKVVEVAATIAKPIVWTAKGLKAAWNLPGKIAEQLTDAIAERLEPLAPYAEKLAAKIQGLSEKAKMWLFGCASPCDFDPQRLLAAVSESADDIEKAAATGTQKLLPRFSRETEEQIQSLLAEHPRLSRVNAERAMTGPPGTTARIAGPGGAMEAGNVANRPKLGDIRFVQPSGRGEATILRREVKALEGNQGKFNNDLIDTADKFAKFGGEGELLLQVPQGSDPNRMLARFRGSVFKGKNVEGIDRYRRLTVTMVDPGGAELFSGPVISAPPVLPATP